LTGAGPWPGDFIIIPGYILQYLGKQVDSFPLKNWLLHTEKETEKRANSLAFECWPLAGLFAIHDDRDPQSKPITTPICILHDTSGAGAFHPGQSDCRHDTIETTTYTTCSAHSEPSWRVEILHLRRCSKNSLMIRLTSCCSSNIHQSSQDVSLVSGEMRCDDNIRTVGDGKFSGAGHKPLEAPASLGGCCP